MNYPFTGQLKLIEIANTAGNVVTNITPPSGKRYLILNVLLKLITDATAVNRYIDEYLTDSGGNVIVFLPESPAHGASVTVRKAMIPGADRDGTGLMIQSVYSAYPLLIDDGYYRVSVTNGQAGDVYSGTLQVLEG